ncbi:MAG: hypothetical protein JSU96_18160 [Acidobacteriota bacterium]|nr:MAG: hypothetical protein JSU96_18160 [Acidobacteriota bacterium]
MKRTIISTILVSIIAFCTSALLAAPNTIVVNLEAKPAEDCFPASALQLPELKEDFTRLCSECVLDASSHYEADFDLVVEDPDSRWCVTIYNRDGELVKELEWTGSLQTGLSKAVQFMREQAIH